MRKITKETKPTKEFTKQKEIFEYATSDEDCNRILCNKIIAANSAVAATILVLNDTTKDVEEAIDIATALTTRIYEKHFLQKQSNPQVIKEIKKLNIK